MTTRPLAFAAAVAALAALFAGPAAATSGFGCYRANTGPSDPLTIRSAPRADSASVGSISWDNQGIVALDAPTLRGEGLQPELFDVWRVEFDVCIPTTLPVGARWCPVTMFDGGGSVSGWIKRRFVDHSECP